MAIAASAVWRVRKAGNNLNGGAYDGTSYPGGTDYTQQDAAAATFSGTLSTSSSTSTTLLDSANGFTASMVGNAVNLAGSGTNATPGFYFIVSFQSAGAVTLDQAPATSSGGLSGGTGRLGGALADWWTYGNANNAVGNRYAPGNFIYLRGSGSANPSTPDWSPSGFTTWVSGDATGGKITLIGENGLPYLLCPGLTIYSANLIRLLGLKIGLSSNPSYSGNGIMPGQAHEFIGCLFDQNGQNSSLVGNVGGAFISGCEFTNTGGGTGGQTEAGVVLGDYSSTVDSCLIHGLRGPGIVINGPGNTVSNNIIAKNGADGILLPNLSGFMNMRNVIRNNTFDANSGNAISVAAAGNLAYMAIFNNLFTNHTGTGKAGVNAAGVLAANERIKGFLDWNSYFNNTNHTIGVSPGSNSTLGVDPAYTSQSTDDYRIGSALKAKGLAGFTSRISGKASPTSYMDPGAVQRQEPTGGGGGIGPTLTVVG